jgi:hypothetical protein
MSIRYVDAAGRIGLQTLPCDPDRIARGFRSNERFFILARSDQIRPVFRVWTRRAGVSKYRSRNFKSLGAADGGTF